MTEPSSVVVLAAGKGTRMRNALPKVLHPLAGLPILGHVLRTAMALVPQRIVVVLAPGMEAVAEAARSLCPAVQVAIQAEPRGTGDAVAAALPFLPPEGAVAVLYGDTPLLLPETVTRLLRARADASAAVAVLGMQPPDPSGYGRFRFVEGQLTEIVEERHADDSLRRDGICNAGIMAAAGARLSELLGALALHPERGEYYLTDIVALARERGWGATAIVGPWVEGLGVNSQAQLADVALHLQQRMRARMLESGVIMEAPATVHLAFDTVIEPGAVVEPYVVFGRGVRVAAGAVVHAFSHLEGATLGPGATAGPFARLRPGAVMEPSSKAGNFVEIKAARLGRGAKVSHLSYIGDAEVGAEVNVGAGTITCNYDGYGKHRTEIGERAFVGSNSLLVAPVRVGRDGFVAAGSTIVRDVPDGALALARARQENLEGRAEPLRAKLKARGKR
ncbi:MAG TPA: bifunctional UDP-N-acetylglucosamine diphosphorylase/glucosamine-1-phosphate N-acetyltransferase GlmU [Geminicoccaceae bacterium]|nr:bifunctional UDP-N-acetylglucosamine diphosphorylase/glucosamine-1-phosphate N-acetyltransferase GlmU [Geminicoccus sp.]HMU50397.1 bifunctional UDP-N-acetylglucosamine diphosphorylase/glucosamine-1-phosphate N-acetyltransferase GlmU [Geminicoccaceae bacterium]